jgi:hypothetical protein
MSNPMDRHDRPRRRRHTSTHFVPETDPGHPEVYQIRIKGHLGQQWADWFCGLTITLEDDGDTVLTGPVVDQAALHGLLKKVRDLGMPLLSVNNVTKIATTHSSRRHYMESQRKNARFAGILLLMGWSGVFIFPFISVLDGANFPMNIDGSGNALVWGALIQMFMVFSCSGIAVFLYPRLKKENPALALWAVVLRGVESAIGLAAATTLLLLAHRPARNHSRLSSHSGSCSAAPTTCWAKPPRRLRSPSALSSTMSCYSAHGLFPAGYQPGDSSVLP